MSILRALKPGLEQHHGMKVTEEALSEAVRLSVRYLPDLYLPDKAIDLLDEGAAYARMEELRSSKNGVRRRELEQELYEAVRDSRDEKAAQLRDKMQRLAAKPAESHRPRAVVGSDVAWAVSARTGIPVGRLTADEKLRLLNMEGILSAGVMGQEQAVAEVVLNRVMFDKYPQTVEDVIKQTEFYRSVGAMARLDEPEQDQYIAVDAAMYGPYILPEDVVYFGQGPINDHIWGRIGGHVFCYYE